MNSHILLELNNHTHDEKPSRFSEAWLEPRLVIVTLLALILSVIADGLSAPSWLQVTFAVVAYVAGGFYGVQSALYSLIHERKLDIDLLMVLAALGAAFIGAWREGAILLFLFSLSNVLQDYAIGRSRNAIKSLLKLYPETAKIKRDDTVQVVKFDQIRVGDIVLIEPGERIPVDGVVVDGFSSVDESPITGESMPVDKSIHDDVFAGTLNGQGALDVRATKTAQNNTLARIIQLVENAQTNQAPTERFLEQFEAYYAAFIVGVISLIIIIPPLMFGVDFASNFYRAMVLMTVASPCALVISVPASFISAIASSARIGVLFKGGAYLEMMAGVKAIAFDKTGTLTYGKPEVTAIIPHSITADELLQIATSIEARSEHPLAKSIVNHAEKQGIYPQPVKEFSALVGRGITANLNKSWLHAGSISHLSAKFVMPESLSSQVEALETAGNTVIGIVRDGVWLGVIALADQVRPEAVKVVAQLKRQGVEVAMLTGDNPRVASAIASQLNITRVHAGLLPADKVDAIKQLQANYGITAMVGDGVNDAPALATADIGVAMGAAGTDVALETADIVLMGDKLELIPQAYQISQKARRVVWQNITFSLAVIVMLIIGTLFIDLPLPFGVLGHEGSTVLVVLNGLLTLLLIPEIRRRANDRSMTASQTA